jgi:hypothetical protein
MNGYRIYEVSIAYSTGEKEQSRLYTLEIHVVNGTHRLARERREIEYGEDQKKNGRR